MNAPVIPVPAPHGVLREGYDTGGFFDEAFELGRAARSSCARTTPRSSRRSRRWTAGMSGARQSWRTARSCIAASPSRSTRTTPPASERILPFDPIPRIVSAADWAVVEAGLRQRITALNRFVHDIYHGQEILHDGVVPRRLVVLARHFRREVVGIDVPDDQYLHVVGSDLIRGDDGRWMVLEDNLRTPSGVSYVLSNRRS